MAQISFASASSNSLAGPSTTRQRHDSPLSNGRGRSDHHVGMPNGIGAKKRGKRREKPWWKRFTNVEDIQDAFKAFGEHCARNQIRVLLIDCLVMTNLFYPALSIYLQEKFPPLHPPAPPSHNAHRHSPSRNVNKEHPLSLLSTPWLDTFFPFPPPLLPRLSWEGWWSGSNRRRQETGWIVDGSETDVAEEDVRLMRVGWADVGGLLDRTEGEAWTERDDVVLNIVRSTAEKWETSYPTEGEGCVRELRAGKDGTASATGPCIVLSPDSTVDGTLPLTKLSMRESVDDGYPSNPVNWPSQGGKVYRSAGVLMKMSGDPSPNFEERWAEAIAQAAVKLNGAMFIEPPRPVTQLQGPKESWTLSLQLANSSIPSHDHLGDAIPRAKSTVPRAIIILYLVFFLVIGSQISSANQAHSRYGLAVTGTVQVCCSAIMSYSVLSLLGWQIGMDGRDSSLPIWILPFVVLVVGAENMSTLTKAVFSIPFSHSVPVRIGLGLSKVGPGIIWASLTDLSILAVVSLCINARPVREFCRFAGLVIITDWFMLHTFFLTVLSIDAQRLELADVLANPDGTSPGARLRSAGKGRRSLLRRFTRARRNKSGSLLIILLSIGAIYYFTEGRHGGSSIAGLYGYKPSIISSLPRGDPFLTTASQLLHLSPSEKLWRSLNPLNLPSIKLSVPRASILILPQKGHHMEPAEIRTMAIRTSRILLPRLKPLFYLFKVVILPQLVTASSLYGLLLFLLKDRELLDAQRTKLGRVDEPRTSIDEPRQADKILHGQMSVGVLPCSHQVDVEHLATSDDGRLALSIGMDDNIVLWQFGAKPKTGTREILRADGIKDDAIVAALVRQGYAVVVTAGGVLQAWRFTEDGPTSASPPTSLQLDGSRAQAMTWESHGVHDDPFADPAAGFTVSPHVIIALGNGSVLVHDIASGDCKQIIPPSTRGQVRTTFLRPSHDQLVILSTSRDGTILYTHNADTWTSRSLEVAANPPTRVISAAACGQGIVVAYRSGLIAVYDLDGHLTQSFTRTSALPIVQVAICGPPMSKCSGCGSSSNKSLFVLASTSSDVHIHHVAEPGQSLCRCPRLDGTSSDPQFLIPPTAASPKHSPKPAASLLPPTNGSVPLSSHGSRRLSGSHRDPPANGDAGHSDESQQPQLLGTIAAADGGRPWRLVGEKVVGLRRVANGIDEHSWEVWSLDLSAPWNGRELLVHHVRFDDLVSSPERVRESSMQAQRDERLLALSGRVSFPSTNASEYEPLAFVDINPCVGTEAGLLFGLGNRIGVLHLEQTKQMARRRSSLGSGLGLSPPPRRDGETKKIS